MAKYTGLLEERETEVSILREENRLLKEQLLLNCTKLDALSEAVSGHELNEKVDPSSSIFIQGDQRFIEGNEKLNEHVDGPRERLEKSKALIEGTEKEPEKLFPAEVLVNYTIISDHFDTPETQMLKRNSSNDKASSESGESVLPFPKAEHTESDNSVKEQELHKNSLVKESQALRSSDEQVRSLSQRLKSSEEICCLLRSKLEELSLERDSLSKKLEDALLESEKLEDMQLERDTLLKKMNEVSLERDKAFQNLGRLRQNLLDMESSTSEKMDNDNILIGDLETRLKSAEDCVGQLQRALSKAQNDLAQATRENDLRSKDSNEKIERLKQNLLTCSEALESKDTELANLQRALGQYYAESDAQERLESKHRTVRELNTTLTRDLKIAEGIIDLKSKELETVTKQLDSAKSQNIDLKSDLHKLQQEVQKLRAALEQSITSLNRMSSDSDFYVDRRIVIKLLVTYFQRHHSKEVLDLMVRMLGFSEEDKRRVGLAQQNARSGGMVRGVFGVPSRIVGGILGSSDSDTSSLAAPGENSSFADMWIDFLLKESQERERREREGGTSEISAAPTSLMANLTRSMPSSPSGGHHRLSSFSGFPSLLPPNPSRGSSSSDLQSILAGDPLNNTSS
ncbi:uncharacterized protein [Physcomitrium patens]|nr:golgin candidate 4-like isoform X2 [Physcomitrium patens]XP_024369262.1 golgin candidate 4-like isoform X2 [Physcomitrium patens]XP_024369263.1 golgin candidate 4-like isoform X2 [Physcomitrium patens]|eukprot:XP_024369261.1 golgin candidate 4-like isoform X2 [Physcomitrella patens]